MVEPQLSIVVPVRNGGTFIRDALNSLQELERVLPCECIFQNANSTDETGEILDAFCCDSPNRHHYNEEDEGQSDAINRGMSRARGRWLTWLCADDLLLPDVAAALDEAEKAGADVVYGDVIFIDGQRVFPAEGTEAYRKGVLAGRRLIIQQPGTCFRREVWNDFGGVRTHLNWAMDYDLFLRLESAGRFFLRTPHFLAVIRIHPDAKTSSGSAKRMVELWSILLQSHRRKPVFFSPRSYLVYTVEFMIKYLEARRNAGKLAPPRSGMALLHKTFWMIASAREREQIRQRFGNLPGPARRILAGLGHQL